MDFNAYLTDSLRQLSTPRLVVYEAAVDHNLRAVREAVESVVPGSGCRHLMSHVKTHKSAWALQKMVESGISSFKCSLNELDMLVDAKVEDIFLAYPLLEHDARRVAEISRDYNGTIGVQVGSRAHADIISAVADAAGVDFDVYLDVDVGMHRTGGAPKDMVDLAKAIDSDSMPRLRLMALHAYDGHNHAIDPGERRALARDCMQSAAAVWQAIDACGIFIGRVVASGTPQFIDDLAELVAADTGEAEIFVSPGTFIYWDTNYDRILPGLFQVAAFVLAQVMDLPGEDLLTLNVGHKRWSFDNGPVEDLSIPGLQFVSVSEEHTVFRRSGTTPDVHIGDHVLIAPKHVCPTVNLWERFTLVDARGRVSSDELPVTARNR